MQLIPTNQWGSRYFEVRYRSPLLQELVHFQPIDRDTNCRIRDTDLSQNEGCICEINGCIPDQPPACALMLSLVIYPVHIWTKFYAIKINVLDENDNSPYFDAHADEYTLRLRENDATEFIQTLPSATDPDLCDNGRVDYTIKWITRNAESFFLFKQYTDINMYNHTVPQLIISQPLDREVQNHYYGLLIASDNGPKQSKHTTTLTLHIVVDDMNDCRPEFILRMSNLKENVTCAPLTSHEWRPMLSLQISEDIRAGSLLTRIVAVDADEGENAKVTYAFSDRIHLQTRRTFTLEKVTGDLSTRICLDRENTPHRDGTYRILIVARDHGQPSHSSTLIVHLHILDVNDNVPVIRLAEEQYRLLDFQAFAHNMTENSKRLWELVKMEGLDEVNDHNQGVIKLSGRHDSEKILTALMVVDPDFQENSTVTCQLDEQFIIFRASVKKNFKMIKKYLQKKLLKLQPLLMYSDEEPRSWNESLRFPENKAENLTNVEEQVWNATKEKAYIIKTTTNLLRPELISDVFIRILCHDGGLTIRRSSERTLRFQFSATNLSAIGFTYITSLSPEVTFQCTKHFSLPSSNEQLTEKNAGLIIPFSHDGSISEICLTLPSNISAGSRLFQVVTARPAQFRLHHVDKNMENGTKFHIESNSGVVTVSRQENIPVVFPVLLRVQAHSAGSVDATEDKQHEYTEILIRIEMINPNMPPDMCTVLGIADSEGKVKEIPFRNNSVYKVSESAPVGTNVFGAAALVCFDKITGTIFHDCLLQLFERMPSVTNYPKTIVLCKETTNQINLFQVILNRTLDRETEPKYNLLLVVVSPQDERCQHNEWHFTTLVSDINDNAPVLEKPFVPIVNVTKYRSLLTSVLPYNDTSNVYFANVSVASSAMENSPVLFVAALDLDADQNSELTFTMEEQFAVRKERLILMKKLTFFGMRKTTGLLHVSRSLDSKHKGRYLLKLKVSDRGIPQPLWSIAFVLLDVVNTAGDHGLVNDIPVLDVNESLENSLQTWRSPHDKMDEHNQDIPKEPTGYTAYQRIRNTVLICLAAFLVLVCFVTSIWVYRLKCLDPKKCCIRKTIKRRTHLETVPTDQMIPAEAHQSIMRNQARELNILTEYYILQEHQSPGNAKYLDFSTFVSSNPLHSQLIYNYQSTASEDINNSDPSASL